MYTETVRNGTGIALMEKSTFRQFSGDTQMLVSKTCSPIRSAAIVTLFVSVIGTLSGCSALKTFGSKNKTSNLTSDSQQLPDGTTQDGENAYYMAQRAGIAGLYGKWSMEDLVSRFSEGSVVPENRTFNQKSTIDPNDGSMIVDEYKSLAGADRNFRKFTLTPFGQKRLNAEPSLIPVFQTGYGITDGKYRLDESKLTRVAVIFDLSILKQWGPEDYLNEGTIDQGRDVTGKSARPSVDAYKLARGFNVVADDVNNSVAEYLLVGRPLPLRFVKAILVHPKAKEKFVSLIKSSFSDSNPTLASKILTMTYETENLKIPDEPKKTSAKIVAPEGYKMEVDEKCENQAVYVAKDFAANKFRMMNGAYLMSVWEMKTSMIPGESSRTLRRTYRITLNDERLPKSTKQIKVVEVSVDVSLDKQTCKVNEPTEFKLN
jgi:hypothetical protein